jgi:hypothetical protein
MNLFFFILFAILIFASSLIGYKKYFSTTLYALAIGGVVNANFFNASSYPIDVFGMSFGIDSIIYTLFLYAVAMMYLYYSKKDAYLLTISSVIAIVLAGLFELIANLLAGVNNIDVWHNFIFFMISAFSTWLVTFFILDLISFIEKKKKLNKYIVVIFLIALCSIMNSLMYYILSGLTNGYDFSKIFVLVGTSLIGKSISLVMSILMLLVTETIDKKMRKKDK